MKIAVAGKGGVGKTTIAALLGDYLARLGKNVWLVDADTTLSLGQASGLARECMPEALIQREALLLERIRPENGTIMHLNPEVGDLPEALSVPLPVVGKPLQGQHNGEKRLLVMGAVTNAGGGCACNSNALLKALLAHLVLEREEWVVVDMEAGVEHLGRGTVAHVNQLLIVSEPSRRALEAAAEIGKMAKHLGLKKQTLILNRASQNQEESLPNIEGLPKQCLTMPLLPSLAAQQWLSASVLGLDEKCSQTTDAFFAQLLAVDAQ